MVAPRAPTTNLLLLLSGLTKIYRSSGGGSKLAVDKLDLTMYSGQITALLGHNGAGKVRTLLKERRFAPNFFPRSVHRLLSPCGLLGTPQSTPLSGRL